MITLEMIDQVVDRTGVSYADAKKALEESNEDVIQAIIFIEDGGKTKFKEDLKIKKDDLIDTLKAILKKGNATKIIVEKNGEEYLKIPFTIIVPAGLLSLTLGVLLAPVILALGAGAYVSNVTVKVIKDDGTEINVNKETEEKIKKAREKAKDTFNNIEENGKKAADKAKKKGEEIKDEVIDITGEVSDEIKEKKEEIKDKIED